MAPQSRPVLLLTRPLAQSLRFLDEAQHRLGPLQNVVAPLLAPQFLTPPPAPVCDAAIFTSETGVLAAEKAGLWAEARPKAAYCVGGRTAQAAQQLGFQTINANGDWHDVLALILADPPQGAMVFACAAEAPDHLAMALRAAGLTLHRREVYCQIAQPLSAEAQHLLAGTRPVLLPLFSPRSAAAFCASAMPACPLWIAALSPAVLDAMTRPLARSITAHRPNSAALLKAMAELLENPADQGGLP